MAGDVNKLVSRMRYWCSVANLGYCWDHRWDIREGGETDCSALYLFCLWEAGYLPQKPTWGNTDTLRSQLEPLGFKFAKANNSKTAPAGVGLLRTGHVALSMGDGTVAQASINELGTVRGGKPGDQTGLETKVSKDPRNWLFWIYPPDVPVSVSPTTSTSKPTTTGGEKVYNFGYVSKGKTGTAVKMFQAAYNIRAGGRLAIDGIAGVNTDAAIRSWQRMHGLTVDGSCGPLTWTSLLEA